jgi:hypothetical protein
VLILGLHTTDRTHVVSGVALLVHLFGLWEATFGFTSNMGPASTLFASNPGFAIEKVGITLQTNGRNKKK